MLAWFFSHLEVKGGSSLMLLNIRVLTGLLFLSYPLSLLPFVFFVFPPCLHTLLAER